MCVAQHTITCRVKLGITCDNTLFSHLLLFGAWILDDGKKFQYFGNCSLIVYKVYCVSESVNMADVRFIVDGEADSHA